ncbi:uncharacterized protein LOC110181269 isoform X1 [Drosophila serrata]|uniref:uncharacterized protein LOC110181269 isoform X1 n=2 Tax=Drosophila serrata TaxID=7274 RepID=UPI000A1D11C0|nr:uncharacterized protein LOC110181269 isoform X1 [Drosophila serrata]
MFKRLHKGHFIDRNADIPAGPPIKDKEILRNSLEFAHPEELAEGLLRANKCRQSKAKYSYLREGGPIMPNDSLGDLLTVDLQKSRFVSFKERFYEELFFKRANVGEIKPAHTKPDSVTNTSRTFGRPSSLTPHESLYSMIMPLKSREQVNSEYTEFHEKRIVSHNHYFPEEPINRKYTHPFDRNNPCGENKTLGDSGLKVKSCLMEGENHVKVIGKAQVDFMERTEAPLGKKFKKYLYEVPDMTFGVTQPSNGDVKTILYNIVSDPRTQLLMDAISHLNMLRLHIRKRDDIHLHHLISVMERSDPEETGLVALTRVLEILHRYRIPMQTQMIRIVMSHYQIIVDEGLCNERVKYREFCKLLSSNEPLPSMGGVATYADLDSQDTTYRLFCADLQKQTNVAKVTREPQVEKDEIGIKELLEPELNPMDGLEASDFTLLRPKVEIEQIFGKLIAKDELEVIWQRLMVNFQDQKGLVSVTQFYEEMKKAK